MPDTAATSTLPGHMADRTPPRPSGGGGSAPQRVADYHRPRPTARQWFGLYWADLLTMAIMGAVGLGVYELHPAPSRSFPITFKDGEIVYPEFAYPLRHEIIPIWAAALLAFFVPLFCFLVMQLKRRSFFTLNNAVFALLYSLITAAVFQVFIKWLIGGLRPHFLSVCNPVIPEGTVGNGFLQVMFDKKICTGNQNEIDDSLESMPSGHSTAIWAGFMLLTLFFNAHLKFLCDRRPRFWKMIVTFAPLLGAFLVSGSLTIDEFHNWYDVLVGGIIGTVTAFAGYRSQFASIWDFRFNHVCLLPGDDGFQYTTNQGIPGDAIIDCGPAMSQLTSGTHQGDSHTGMRARGHVGDRV